MPKLIKIRNWDENFEKAQSRKIDGPLPWVAIPTKHDGKGYRRVMAAGPDIFAVWVCLLQVGAKCKRRGVLADEAGPLSTFDLHLKTSLPESVIERAIPILASTEIGWICVTDYHRDTSQVAIEDRTGQDRKDCCAVSAELGQGQPAAAVDLSEFEFPVAGRGDKTWTLTKSKLAEYVEAYPALDVPNEIRRARQWVRDNERNRKTAAGMLKFLGGWLARSQNRGGGKDVKPKEFHEIPHHVFMQHFHNGDFLIRPKTDPPLPDGRQRVWGQLKGLRKVESYKENGATP